MKPIAIVLAVFAAAVCAASATVLALAFWTHAEAAPAPGSPEPMPVAAPSSTEGAEALAAQLDMLGGRLADLEGEVARLRESASRQPASPADVDADAVERTAAALDITPEQRDLIEQVLADIRATEEAEREERRLQREEDEILARAERVAREIGLSAADQKALADHYSVAAVKRRDLIDRAREGDTDREAMRDEFMALRDWSEQSLVDTFGGDLARQIQEVDRGSRFGDRERGRGEPGGGGNNGGGGGGRGRRGS